VPSCSVFLSFQQNESSPYHTLLSHPPPLLFRLLVSALPIRPGSNVATHSFNMRLAFPLVLSVSSGVVVSAFSLSTYSLGLHGLYPHHTYRTTDVVAPELNWVQDSNRCAGGNIIIGPRGWATPTEAPLVLDSHGELVYAARDWGSEGVMDWEVQTYKGQKYLTFWNGTDDGTHGHGQYYMVRSKSNAADPIWRRRSRVARTPNFVANRFPA
jgi:hypothetical protein